MRVLITGGTGFIGREVTRQLVARGHHVLLLQRRKTDKIEGVAIAEEVDLDQPDSYRGVLEKFAPEAVCHLGWEGIPDFSPEICIRNLRMTTTFLQEVFKLTGCRKILSAGSCWEYGKKEGLCKESDQEVISNAFTWAKSAVREFGLIRASETGKTFGWFRVFFVYGPGQRSGSLVPSLIRSIKKGEAAEIKNPKAAQDFVYIEDVAECFVKGVEGEWPTGVYNLGGGGLTPVGVVARMVSELWQQSSTVGFQGHEEATGFWASKEKAMRDLGWEATTTLEAGLKKTLERERDL